MKKLLLVVIAIAVVMMASCTGTKDKTASVEKPSEYENVETTPQKEDVVLYYASDDATGLKAETREVSEGEGKDPEFLMSLLIAGTQAEGLVSIIPPGTKLNGCTVSDGICTVDVSADFISEKGSAIEQMVIYSVVNTLCSVDGIDKVSFLIDGKSVPVFGSYVFDEPFTADTTLVR